MRFCSICGYRGGAEADNGVGDTLIYHLMRIADMY